MPREARLRLLAGLLVLAAPAFAGEPEPPPLTLRAACQEAAESNNEASAARLEAAADYERQEQAAARYWPRLELSETYRRTNDPSIRPNILLNENMLPDTRRVTAESYRSQAELTYTLFDGGARGAAVRAAQSESSASMRSSEAVRSRVLAAVADSFLAALYAEEELRVGRAEAARMEKRLVLAQTQKAQGRGLEEDVLLAEYHLERARRQVLAAGNASENARELLGRLLGRKGKVAGPLAEGTANPLALPAEAAAEEAAEAAALRDSPELARSLQERSARQAALSRERAAWWPRLDASVSYYCDDNSPAGLDSNKDSYLLGVQMSWPLFDGGLRRARIAEARSRSVASDYRAREAEQQAPERARRLARALAEAGRDSAVARRKLAADEAVCKRVEKSWDAGRAAFGELLKAQSDLADSQLAEIGARLAERRAAARLLEATGFWANWQ